MAAVPRNRRAAICGLLALCIAGAAPDAVRADSPFRGPPAGFRSLAISFGMGTLTPANATPRDLALEHAYVDQINRQEKQPVVVSVGDCVGGGTTPGRPIEISGLTRPEHEIGGGIACALARYPGARLFGQVSTVLITDDVRTLLTVNLVDAAGKRVQVYTDATRFAAAVPAP